MNKNQHLHEVVITAIIVKGGKYLILRRSKNKKRFPGMWTVPGGKLETTDYLNLPKDTEFYWYNVLERTLKREVAEETGIDIEDIGYVTSLATIHEDGSPSIVISCMADFRAGKVRLNKEENDAFAWVSLEKAQRYKLIDGIYDELVLAENKRKGKKVEWKRFKK